jgi:hypothetical protein
VGKGPKARAHGTTRQRDSAFIEEALFFPFAPHEDFNRRLLAGLRDEPGASEQMGEGGWEPPVHPDA